MKKVDLWKLCMLNVFAAPVRSLLTVLGMAIGIGAILAVLSLGEAGKTQVRSEMTRLGIDKVWVNAAQDGALRRGDAQFLQEMLDTQATEVIYLSCPVTGGTKAASLPVVGCDAVYLDMMDAQVEEGRMLYPLEWESSGMALMGSGAAQTLGVQAGDVVSVAGIPFAVCGILAESAVFSRVDAASAVFVPSAAVVGFTGGEVHEVMMNVPKRILPQTLAEQAEKAMGRRNLEVETTTLQVQLEAADSVVEVFVDVLKWVAVICILVGGIGVMNILLVSVRERRREIGIMKSLGTTKGQVCLLFLMEAAMYAVIGGILGILMGMGLIRVAGNSIGLKALVRMQDCVVVMLAALTVGVFFGVAPASKAAELKCVDALREEP